MAIAFSDSGGGSILGTSLAVGLTGGAAAENTIIVAAFAGRSFLPTVVPTGFSSNVLDSSTNANINAAFYYKVCGASEPTTYTWEFSNQRVGIALQSFTGVDTSTPIHKQSALTEDYADTATEIAWPTVVSTVDGCMQVWAYADNSASTKATTWANSTNDLDHNSGSSFAGMGSLLQSTAGTTVAETQTTTDTTMFSALTLALLPAGAGGGSILPIMMQV